MIDMQRLILLLKQGKVVATKEIPKIIIAIRKKNEGKKLTPKQLETYNDMANLILEEVIENKSLYNLTKNSLKRKNSEFSFF